MLSRCATGVEAGNRDRNQDTTEHMHLFRSDMELKARQKKESSPRTSSDTFDAPFLSHSARVGRRGGRVEAAAGVRRPRLRN